MALLRPVVLLLAASILVACNGPDADAGGREIYLETCARCHAADLSGGIGPGLGEGTNAATLDEDVVTAIIADGRGRMPSFRQTLTADQIGRVVEYLLEEQGRP